MKFFKNKEIQINWLQILMIFLLGALVLSNVFLFMNNMTTQNEIEKLKKDDVVIAQAINNLLSQLKLNNGGVNQ